MQALASRNNLSATSRPAARPATMRRAVVANATKLGKTALVEKLAATEELKLSQKQAKAVLDTILDTIVDTVADGGEVTITGFGSFKSRQRAARTGRNPSTGEPLEIKASTSPAFSAGKTFKDAVRAGGQSAPAEPPAAARKTASKTAK